MSWEKIKEEDIRVVLYCSDLPEDCSGSVNGEPFEIFAYPHRHEMGFERCPHCQSSMKYKEMLIKQGDNF